MKTSIKTIRIDGKVYATEGDIKGYQLTNCCHAFSTFDEYGCLYCKACYEDVPMGQGDGSGNITPEELDRLAP